MKIQQNDLVSDMLQSLLKKLLLQKCVTDVQHDVLDQKSNDLTVRLRSRSAPSDSSDNRDDWVKLREHERNVTPCKQRALSCPDESYLHQYCCDTSLSVMDLRRICQQGETLLETSNGLTSCDEDDEVFTLDETNGIEEQNENNQNINGIHVERARNNQMTKNIDYETVERLSNLFDKDVNEAVKIVLALPDGDLKHDLIHSLQYQLNKLKQQVTENCHAVIFSMIVNVE